MKLYLKAFVKTADTAYMLIPDDEGKIPFDSLRQLTREKHRIWVGKEENGALGLTNGKGWLWAYPSSDGTVSSFSAWGQNMSHPEWVASIVAKLEKVYKVQILNEYDYFEQYPDPYGLDELAEEWDKKREAAGFTQEECNAYGETLPDNSFDALPEEWQGMEAYQLYTYLFLVHKKLIQSDDDFLKGMGIKGKSKR
jgi:hypothetical protein